MRRLKIYVLVSTDISHDQRVIRIATSLSQHYEVMVVGHQKADSQVPAHYAFDAQLLATNANKGPRFYFELNRAMIASCSDQHIDILICNDPDTLCAGLQIRRKTKCQLVYDSHELFTDVPELRGKHLKKSIWRYIEARGVARSSLCYTVNETIAKELSARYGGTFHTIKNLPMRHQPPSPLKEEKFTIIYQGAVNAGRRLKDLVRVAEILSDIQVWIVGDGDLFDEISEMVQGKSLSERVVMLGKMTPQDLKLLTPRAHLGYNLLDRSSKSYRWSLANKFFDYAYGGVPSINSDFPEYRNHLKEYETGIAILDDRVEQIAESIDDLRSDEQRYSYLVQQCQLARSEWSWDREQEKLLALIDRVAIDYSSSSDKSAST